MERQESKERYYAELKKEYEIERLPEIQAKRDNDEYEKTQAKELKIQRAEEAEIKI